MNAFDFELPALGGGRIALSAYRGRPLLIANTASKCGFTPQYAGLQRIWDAYRGRGLIVLGVPSNDFGGQEPAGEPEIAGFCRTNYGVSFPMTGKLHVSGAGADPFFRALAAEGGVFSMPRWNFYKYLVGRDGKLLTWFSSLTRPDAARLRRAVERALA